jgi:hypothetical protein
MPALHKIDDDIRLITTIWCGEASDSELIDALLKYQRDIKGRFGYSSYNEIVDFSNASGFTLSTNGIRQLAQIAAKTDVQGTKTKLAIITGSLMAFGLGRMYEAYRSLLPRVSKDVRVFKNHREALEWIESKAGNPDIDP